MAPHEWTALRRWLATLCGLVVLRSLGTIVAGYGSYLPSPDFRADFLLGREATFFRGGYREAFIVHLLAGPPAMLLGLVLASGTFRRRFPRSHRRLGWIEGAIVLFGVVPSGMVMAWHPLPTLPEAERFVAGLGFGVLAILTGVTTTRGLLAARGRDHDAHGRWMRKLLALLFSPVVLRIMGGLADSFLPTLPWTYPASAWASWLLPLFVVERLVPRRGPEAFSRPTRAESRPAG